MGIFSNRAKMLYELKINGKNVEDENDDFDIEDKEENDAGAENAPATTDQPEPAPAVEDTPEGEDANAVEDEGADDEEDNYTLEDDDDSNVDGEGTTDNEGDDDYTIDDEGGDDTEAAATDNADEGVDTGTEDDTAGAEEDTTSDDDTSGDDGEDDFTMGDDGGESSGGGAEGGSSESGDDTSDDEESGGDSSSGGNGGGDTEGKVSNPTDAVANDEDRAAEESMYDTLTDDQKRIRVLQLKLNFKELYDTLLTTIESVSNIPKTTQNLETLKRLNYLLVRSKSILVAYIDNNFDQNPYMENYTTYLKYIAIFRTVAKVIEEVNEENK